MPRLFSSFRVTFQRDIIPGVILAGASFALSACSILPAAGPSSKAVGASVHDDGTHAPVQLVDVNDIVARRLTDENRAMTFSEALGEGTAYGSIVGRGDILDISIWEAPPAALFGIVGTSELTRSTTVATAVARNTPLPEQMVEQDGTIHVPFAGFVPAAGRSTQQIAQDITVRLRGKAHDPQVIVRLSNNAAANVTVVGEVEKSVRMPLTPKGERLLDALASAGGVKKPVDKMTIQLTRGEKVEAMPLLAVIKDPRQNIRLQTEDVVTLLFQPYSFTVLGATKKNEEVPFEATGLTLSQALGRAGGLDDQKANTRGVFIFRFEDPKLFSAEGKALRTTPEGKIPVIYRVNMKDPQTLFVAQSFPIRDKDVIYVSNAPLADFSKFLQAISQIVYPVAVIQQTNIF